jgi:ABC-type transport system substrate-binding protein
MDSAAIPAILSPFQPFLGGCKLARTAASVAILFAAFTAGVIGCTPRREAARRDDSSVTILYPGDEHAFSLLWDEDAKFLVFLPLVTRNAQGELEGRLARSWEHSPDYRTWTVHLRSDIRWHDGMPVTANDIKFTLEFLSRPEVLQQSPGAVSATVLDDTTYTLTLHRGTAGSPLDDDWTVYYPKHLLSDSIPRSGPSGSSGSTPWGTGPTATCVTCPARWSSSKQTPTTTAAGPGSNASCSASAIRRSRSS